MAEALDTDKLGKLLALAGSDHDAEALAALRKARGLLSASGMSFTDVAQRLKEPAPAPVVTPVQRAPSGPTFTDFFAGFDDHMEAKEPGYKARKAAERAERLRQEAEQRAGIIAKYGSERAAKLPCPRDRLLRKALKHLKRKLPVEFANGVFDRDTLDGWRDRYGDKMPDTVRSAVESAYPMPVNLRQAREETMYWRKRDEELRLLWCPPGACGGDTYLNLEAGAREKLVDDLWWNGPILTLDDLHVRLESIADNSDRLGEAGHAAVLEAYQRLVIDGLLGVLKGVLPYIVALPEPGSGASGGEVAP